MKHAVAILSILAVWVLSPITAAQPSYPTKPIRLIVPFPSGGGTDILARLIVNKMTEALKWNVIVDNRAGAGGNIGMEVAAKSAPDGYTLVVGQTSNLAINPALYQQLPYDPIKDLAPISLIAASPIALVVSAKASYKALGDIIAVAKAKPDAITYGTAGNGTVAHLTAELLQRTAGIKMTHVPYKGFAQGFPDLSGGRINLFLGSLETTLPQIKGGALRALAVTSIKRVSVLPDVPTVAETYKGFESTTWFGILAPAKTPEPILTRLSNEIERILQMSDVREHATAGGIDVRAGPKEFAAVLKTDLAKWSRTVKEAGVKLE